MFWTELQRAGGGGSGMAAPHEKQFTQAERANKRRRMTSRGAEDAISRFHLLISQKLERPQWQIVELYSLALMIYDVHTMAAREHARQSFCLE